jgi:hypothetical protein
MVGAIRFRHVTLHPFLTCRVVGWRGVARIVIDMCSGQHRTFLSYSSMRSA